MIMPEKLDALIADDVHEVEENTASEGRGDLQREELLEEYRWQIESLQKSNGDLQLANGVLKGRLNFHEAMTESGLRSEEVARGQKESRISEGRRMSSTNQINEKRVEGLVVKDIYCGNSDGVNKGEVVSINNTTPGGKNRLGNLVTVKTLKPGLELWCQIGIKLRVCN